MDKGQVIGGVICLALAALLGMLNVILPADKLLFTVGDQNMPWVPVAILGVVGALLLASARRGGRTAKAQATKEAPVMDPSKAELNRRLETIGWGCFLIMLGGFMFVSDTIIAKGFWSIGVGVIMLGLNAARYLNHIRMSGFTTALGVLALVGGILQLAGLEAIEGAFLLIILGAFLLLKPWFDRRQLFGRAEEA